MKISSLLKLLSFALVVAFVSCGDEDAREKFNGTWEGTLSGCVIEIPFFGEYSIPDLPMSMTMTDSTTENEIDIVVSSSFFETTSTTGTVSDNTITIAPFVVSLAAGPSTIDMTMSGPGTYADNTIDMDVKVEASGAETECTLQLTK